MRLPARKRVVLHKSTLPGRMVPWNIFLQLIAHTYIYKAFVIQSLLWVKRIVSTETRVSLKRWDISAVACGRRTERGDKEGDKCECRRGTRAKKIYEVTRERKEKKGESKSEKVRRLRGRAKKIAVDVK